MALPVTTIIPFAELPSCAAQCYPFYDANGACVPPNVPTAAPSVYDACFCNFGSLQPFKTGTSGVCDSACDDPSNLSSIQGWFTSLCAGATASATGTSSSSTSSSTAAGSNSGSGQSGGGGSWFDTHMKWVVMLIIVFIGITGIWVGACIWRRKYLKKRDRMYELGKGLPSSIAVNTQGNLVGPGMEKNGKLSGNQGLFGSGSDAEKVRR